MILIEDLSFELSQTTFSRFFFDKIQNVDFTVGSSGNKILRNFNRIFGLLDCCILKSKILC